MLTSCQLKCGTLTKGVSSRRRHTQHNSQIGMKNTPTIHQALTARREKVELSVTAKRKPPPLRQGKREKLKRKLKLRPRERNQLTKRENQPTKGNNQKLDKAQQNTTKQWTQFKQSRECSRAGKLQQQRSHRLQVDLHRLTTSPPAL